MKQFFWLTVFLAVFLFCAGVTPPVSAFYVSSVNVDPGGYQAAGTSMTVISILDFPAAGPETFPTTSELKMRTELVDPYWVPILVLDGQETRMPITGGEELVLPGLYLSYSPSQNVQLMVTLSGKIPSDRFTGQNILEIQERDAAKNIVSSAHVAMPEVPLVPLSTQSTLTKKPTITKTYTPIPTDTTQASPAGAGVALVALAGAVLLAMRRR